MSLFGNVVNRINRVKKYGFWGSLVRTNTGVSSLNFYLIMTTLVGICLLMLVIFAITWEVIHNDTVQSDINGWAAFVGAVATLFASAGIAKGWSNWSENKFRQNENENILEDTDGLDDAEYCHEVGDVVEETVVPAEKSVSRAKRRPYKNRNKTKKQ